MSAREEILALAGRHVTEAFPKKTFVPGETVVPVSGKVLDAADLRALLDASLDLWLTAGRFAETFEQDFARCLGRRRALLCNSGSSANLLAISALTSPRLGDRRLVPGDEVVTCAAGFPTTVNPILQSGLVPVFVDALDPETGDYNADPRAVEEAVGSRTRAIILGHTLGNPFDLGAVTEIVRRHRLFLIEDACDALGSMHEGRPVGTFGDAATYSFYPAHHVTCGEGGAVTFDAPALAAAAESFRDWGRDCWCQPGCDNTCGKRFDWNFPNLPLGIDHKYVYSHVGYNLKATDMQAAILVSQMGKISALGERRRRNFRRLREGLADLEHLFVLPSASAGSDPSWFGFPLTCREGVGRREAVRYLEDRKVTTRALFGGNLLRQPAFCDVPRRQVGDLRNADRIMRDTFWVGCYPGISDEMVDYVVEVFHAFRLSATSGTVVA